MMDQAMNIAAILVTFNRLDTTLEAIRRLAAQTRPLDQILVLDNGSKPEVLESLRTSVAGTKALTLIELGENLGPTEAFKRGCEKAFAGGADFVWLLDDDAWAKTDALHHLLEGGLSPDVVHASLIVDPQQGDLSFPVAQVAEGGQRILDTISDLPEGSEFPVRGAWLGALYSKRIYDAVGGIDGSLFIRGDDEEFPARIRQAGYPFLCRVGSRVEHPRMRHDSITLLGKTYFHERNLPLWKAFYQVRNQTYVRKRFSGTRAKGLVIALANLVLACAYAIAKEDQKSRRIAVYSRAWWDGWRGRLGKTIDPTKPF